MAKKSEEILFYRVNALADKTRRALSDFYALLSDINQSADGIDITNVDTAVKCAVVIVKFKDVLYRLNELSKSANCVSDIVSNLRTTIDQDEKSVRDMILRLQRDIVDLTLLEQTKNSRELTLYTLED